MVTIIFEAEVIITENQYKKFKSQGYKMVLPQSPIATVFGKEIKIVRAYVKLSQKEKP